MRFSLRWVFVVTAFASLVAAAIVTGNDLLGDLVWAVVMMAMCYATVVACTAIGRPKAIAVGFLMLATANLAALYLVPRNVPSMRFIAALGYTVTDEGYIWETPTGFGPAVETTPAAVFHTINAIGVLVAGLIGCLIGRLAASHADANADHRQAGPDDP